MTFTESVKTCFSKAFDLSGRASRSEYWWFALFGVLGSFVFGFIDGLVFGSSNIQVLSTLFSLAILLPSIMVSIRRLHDRDMVGWWMFLLLIPLVGALVLIVIFLFKGTDGPNRFGPDPLA